MGLIVRLIDTFAKSKTGVKLYKWAASPKGQKFLYNTMPTIESGVACSMYVIATERQKKLDRREKNVLQWQNIGTAAIGMTLGTYLNKKVFSFGEKIIEHLDPKKVPDIHKINGALHVLLPIAATSMTMRFLLPVITAFTSGEVEERRAKKAEKLNILA